MEKDGNINKPNAEEILKRNCKNKRGHWIGLTNEGVLKAMEQYRNEGIREEMIKFGIWFHNTYGSPEVNELGLLISEVEVDEYLKQKP
jgi:hypothetical protein